MTLECGKHRDKRGILIYSNDFNVSNFRRCYHITHDNTKVIRAWQGHQKESKAFWVTQGAFLLQWVSIDDFSKPNKKLEVKSCRLDFETPRILILPGGIANGFQALEKHCSVMVFSNMSIESAKDDDYRWEKNYFMNAEWK